MKNKTNEVKFWLTIYSYFDVSMIVVIIIKKNKYLKKSQNFTSFVLFNCTFFVFTILFDQFTRIIFLIFRKLIKASFIFCIRNKNMFSAKK
jgi:hypothetical protein